MTLRKRRLPEGWYPLRAAEIQDFLTEFSGPRSGRAFAATAPHAGWRYSGKIAAAAASALDPSAETVVLIGGHLPEGAAPLFFEEDGAETPLGPLEIDRVFRDALRKELAQDLSAPKPEKDRYQDNTIEVLLPIIAYFFPKSRIVPFRLPVSQASFEAGKAVSRIGTALRRKTVVLGSTDLTHYGEVYGFTPHGLGRKALEWMKTVNDQAFIQAVLSGAPAAVLARAEQDRSACSAGAVLGALGFAQAVGADKSELLAYGTSADACNQREPPDTFVGYAAMAWHLP
ncbi:MAG: AmmeMemoRadiSam system protein B [Spirochaetaceae bacterium]|jgi:AmmeMemoRadiSam system protein B|nr:AmmeMemoRadiSam system protein B [Spirochaetaceae bacterium]